MELRRFELLTPTLPALCSTKLSYNPVRVFQIEKKKLFLSRGDFKNFENRLESLWKNQANVSILTDSITTSS